MHLHDPANPILQIPVYKNIHRVRQNSLRAALQDHTGAFPGEPADHALLGLVDRLREGRAVLGYVKNRSLLRVRLHLIHGLHQAQINLSLLGDHSRQIVPVEGNSQAGGDHLAQLLPAASVLSADGNYTAHLHYLPIFFYFRRRRTADASAHLPYRRLKRSASLSQ